MKILLVRPPVPKHTIGLKHIMICEPLELEYIAAAIPLEHEVMIFDHLVENNFYKRLIDFAPDIVVSSCYKTGTNEVIKLFRKVKTWNPHCITIAGGVHATLVPKDFVDVSVDIIGKGDGTFLLPEIIEALSSGKSLYNISGLEIPIADRKTDSTPERQYMPKADLLPLPRRDLISHLQHKYYYLMHQPVATIKTTWGCWYKCNFCFTWKITDGATYSRSPENIADELDSLTAEDVYIVDDIFLIKNSRLRKLADIIKSRNIKKKYLVYARADFIAENEDVIAEWAGLGLSAVFIGLEAITDDELTSMNKELPASDNIKAIEVLKRYKIDTYGSLIPGADYTEKEWNQLWTFIKDNGLYYVNISPHTPLPGSDMWEATKNQITIPEDAHGLFDLSHMILPTKLTLKQYYWQLLKLYAKTILNLSRAQDVTQRTLPSIWSVKYFKVIWGSLKIGKQFWSAHKHHTPKEIEIARYKGEVVPGLTYQTKLAHPSFVKKAIFFPLPILSDPG
ncbi:MAG: cobalamin-dependent protein [Saprospiraceae bacterium]|nr:cobalamin-dependent protein [Saprospiraceae bacterium]